jgi:hypothetical protein
MKPLLPSLAACAVLAAGAPANAEGVKIGTLSCHVSSGWGLVLASSRSVNCVFNGQGRVENYTGSINKVGVDLGYQNSGVMIWTVLAPTGDIGTGTLAGKYAGATAGASFGVGLGANALVGGSMGHVALQPLSVEGMTGVNIAGGVGALTLEPAPSAAPAT